jgi:protein O-GlcNAcase/histone acetyltransferase
MLQSDFLGGVVEGFYGRPWSQQQRLHLIDRLAVIGLNTYFYAPKNDLKHRSIWREPYSDCELQVFRELVQASQKRGLNFIYGLSPGLDIRFSDEAERNRIKLRIDQLRMVGVRHFALLFDDLPGKIGDDDRRKYECLAAAQCDVTSSIFTWVRVHDAGARFLFCPTPYCDRMDRMQHGGARYLDEVGQSLSREIDILWTGPEIVSGEIPVESIDRLSRRLRRPPLIWDNLFANDYDMRRQNCGPYSGRPRELIHAVRGIVINPNNEYPLNFIPLHTFAEFLHGNGEWKAREAFLKAAAEWLSGFETVTQPLSLEDLILLADCFYLPHCEGREAEQLLSVIDRLLTEPVAGWGSAHEQFSQLNARIQAAFDRLTELHNRELFDAWSRRAWELKEELMVIEAILARKKDGDDIVNGVHLDICVPGTFRGGLLARLARKLSMDAHGKISTRTAR